MPFRASRCVPLLLLLVFAFTAFGCSKKDPTPDEEGLSQGEADDLTQSIASMAAIDRGGWLTVFESTLLAHPRTNYTPPAAPTRVSGGVARRDTTFTRGTITWTLSYVYYDTLSAPSGSWSGGTWYLESATTAVGPMTLHDFDGSTGGGMYGHADTLNVDGYRDTVSNLSFRSLSTVDSALVTISSSADGDRFYYFDNLIDCDVVMSKDPAQLFPVSGTLEVHAFVYELASASRAETNRSLLDATLTVTFDGTQTPPASITANTLDATEEFHYTIDLRTGAIVRTP